jgi:hypothetical protein
MIRKVLTAVSACVILFCAFSCAVKTEKLRLNEYEGINALSGSEIGPEMEALQARVNGLWSDLKDQKLTTYITKKKLSQYFESEKDLAEFIAIYASLMRQNSFSREVVLKYRVNGIKIEPNGVIARVDIEIWGRIYFLWYAKIHETQRWEKSGGRWFMRPEAY